jgi:hypothetical protein
MGARANRASAAAGRSSKSAKDSARPSIAPLVSDNRYFYEYCIKWAAKSPVPPRNKRFKILL